MQSRKSSSQVTQEKARYNESDEDKIVLLDAAPSSNSVAGILSQIKFGRFHIMLMMACGSGWMADNMWEMELFYVLPAIQKEFRLTTLVAALTLTLECIGLLIGAVVWGRLSDQIGRKKSFMITLMIAGVFGTASAFSVNYPMFLVLVFCFSVGIGGNLPVDGAMFGEFMATHVRGPLMVLMSIFWVLGGTAGAGLCWILVPNFMCDDSKGVCKSEDNRGWRYVLFATGLFNLALFFLRFGIPESPRYLAKKGKDAEVREVLQNIIKTNKSLIELPENIEVHEPQETSIKESLSILFSGKYARTTVLLICSWFFPYIGIALFNSFLPALLALKGSVSESDVYRNTFIYQAAGVPGTVLAAFMLETRLGRKWTLVISTASMSLLLFLFLISTDQTTDVVFACLFMVGSQIFYSALYTYTPEVFPTEVRTTAVGICSCFSRIAGAVSPLVGGMLLDKMAIPTLIYTAVAANGVAAFCMLFYDRETRGKDLE